MKVQHILTDDGSSTFYVPELNEHYHSTHGAIQESMHIFIREGYQWTEKSAVSILEIGFGTGLNAFLTLLESERDKKVVRYDAIEKYPLDEKDVGLLNYATQDDPAKAALFRSIHSAKWDEETRISGNFILNKRFNDIRKIFLEDSFYDLVYFDAFGPEVQPELWSEEVFTKLYHSMKTGAVLLTYSVKGSVTRAMKASGFITVKLPGPPGKREITRAIKPTEDGK